MKFHKVTIKSPFLMVKPLHPMPIEFIRATGFTKILPQPHQARSGVHGACVPKTAALRRQESSKVESVNESCVFEYKMIVICRCTVDVDGSIYCMCVIYIYICI